MGGRVFFRYQKGPHRLDIRNVRLTSGKLTLTDKHFGFAGSPSRNNVWSFKLPKNAPKMGWTLAAEVQGSGGTNSHGAIIVAGLQLKKPRNKLPNGKGFASPAELKKLLLSDYRDQITDNVIRRLLAYALGRKVRPIDRPAMAEIRKSLRANHHRMTALIEAVVLSYPFRHKED